MGHDPETGLTMIIFTNLQAGPDGAQTANEIAQALIPVVFGGGGEGVPEDDSTEPL
jgi:hypothetical protein